MRLKKNNKGFSFVELVVVIALIGVAVSLAGGALSTIYHARSKRAAETLDAVISQCKIDAMSNLDCELRIELDDDNYYVRLYSFATDDEGNTNEVIYKSERLASDRLNIFVGSETEPISDNPLIIRFNRSTGAIQKAQYGDTSDIFGASVTTVITLSSVGTHTVTLYKNTGEHVLDA